MRSTRSLVMLVLALFVPAQRASAQQAAGGAPRDLDDKTMLGAAVTHANLTLIPVVTRARPGARDRDYLVLDEAFERKLVVVREKENETVNELVLENKGSSPLFVMAGEVILGGKQDRIIGKDIILGANQTVTVPVFCVEPGRGSEEGGSRKYRSGNALAHTKLRLKANYEDQGEVWNEVADKTKKRNVETSTQTYRKVAEEKTVAKSVESYAKAFDRAFTDDQTIGFVVVLNGQISGMETFGSPKLFRKLKDKMLRSYYVEAVDNPVDAAAAARAVPVEKVKEFNQKARDNERRIVVEKKGSAGKTMQVKDADVSGSEVVDEDAQPAAQPEVYKSKYRR